MPTSVDSERRHGSLREEILTVWIFLRIRKVRNCVLEELFSTELSVFLIRFLLARGKLLLPKSTDEIRHLYLFQYWLNDKIVLIPHFGGESWIL